jgi:hypothetical protein
VDGGQQCCDVIFLGLLSASSSSAACDVRKNQRREEGEKERLVFSRSSTFGGITKSVG